LIIQAGTATYLSRSAMGVAAMAEVEREYAYKAKWWAILYTMGYFALGAVASGYLASSSGSDFERVLFWVLCGLSIGCAAVVGARAVERLLLRRRVAFTAASLVLPKSSWSSEEVAIAYGTITGLFISSGVYAPWAGRVAIDCQATTELPTGRVRRARFLYLTYTGGERRIAAAELPSHATFEEVCELLTARVRACQRAGRAEMEPTT
jgi:hypothetical protein